MDQATYDFPTDQVVLSDGRRIAVESLEPGEMSQAYRLPPWRPPGVTAEPKKEKTVKEIIEASLRRQGK